MSEFKIKIAGQVAQVQALYESTREYFRAYLTSDNTDFSISVIRDDLAFEQDQLDEEARLEGFRLRKFTDPFLERAAIQRKYAEHLFDQGILLFHGSAVALDGQGYLFTARSGTGKSTHTRLWRETFPERAVMINDDKPFLHITEKGILASGSPWSGKHGLDSNITVPLKGICILCRGLENTIQRVHAKDALPMLRHESYCPLDPQKQPRFDQLVNTLSQALPLWQMECTRDPLAVQVAYNAMSANQDY